MNIAMKRFFPVFSTPRRRGTILVLGVATTLFTVGLFGRTDPVSAQSPDVPSESVPISQRKLNVTYGAPYERLVGLTPYGTAILTSTADYTSNKGDVLLWNVRKEKVVNKRPLDRWISGYDLALSPDGKTLVSSNKRSSLYFPEPKAYRITSLNTSNLKASDQHSLKNDDDSVGQLFLPSDNSRVVLKMSSVVGREAGGYRTKWRYTWLNLKTGKYDKEFLYLPGRGADKILYSPDQKYLLCLYEDMEFDLVDDRVERNAIVDVLDAKTGKVLWHIAGTDKKPAGQPLFFVSPTRFVSSDSVYDIQNKSVAAWQGVKGTEGCLAAVPNHEDYGLFLAKDGTELRNWKTGRVLRRWPTLQTRGRVLFSPNLDMFSYKSGEAVSFWNFSRLWLSE